ncbi:MAG: ribonuclease III [Desulfobacterales bacterium]|nr:ribonuclease III [Desulfobacterales bacterium]
MNKNRLAKIEEALGHKFKSIELLEQAFTHSSFANEQPGSIRDNERLEFLGDAVLSLILGHTLVDMFPDSKEGNLSRMRASMVNDIRLASIARSLNFGDYIQLGKGEMQTGGNKKRSILADAFEAVIAAIYLDGGFEAAGKFVKSQFSNMLNTFDGYSTSMDYKSQLQEYIQQRHNVQPNYTVTDESGPDHCKTFTIQLQASDVTAEGTGKSKKLAEQNAARNAWDLINRENSED